MAERASMAPSDPASSEESPAVVSRAARAASPPPEPVAPTKFEGKVGERFHMNGTLYAHHASGADYGWQCLDPYGRVVDIMNADTAGASFMMEKEGKYTVTLHGADGPVTVEVHASK